MTSLFELSPQHQRHCHMLPVSLLALGLFVLINTSS
jgi:hypothetical protein